MANHMLRSWRASLMSILNYSIFNFVPSEDITLFFGVRQIIVCRLLICTILIFVASRLMDGVDLFPLCMCRGNLSGRLLGAISTEYK